MTSRSIHSLDMDKKEPVEMDEFKDGVASGFDFDRFEGYDAEQVSPIHVRGTNKADPYRLPPCLAV